MRAKFFLIVMLLFSITILFAENPSSTNYILQQWGFVGGSNPADPPQSTNYILVGSAIGAISGDNTNSSNYTNYPGYYLGPLEEGILAPENVIITVENDSVHISWNPVDGATSYKVYYSENPYSGFDNFVVVYETSWSEALSEVKRFYYVKAVK